MNNSKDWDNFYNSCRADGWPNCNINEIKNLPNNILTELVLTLLNSDFSLSHNHKGYPNTLFKIYDIINLIGHDYSLQSISDAIFLYNLIFSKKPKFILEVGRYHGYSTSIISGAIIDSGYDGKIFSIDIVDNTSAEIKKLLRSNTFFITDDCANILENVIVKDIKFDLFFIDNDKPYNDTYQDFLNYIKLSNTNSYFLFHNMQTPNIGNAVLDVIAQNTNLQYLGMFGDMLGLVTFKENLIYD